MARPPKDPGDRYRTAQRSFRIPDDEYLPAQRAAEARGESLTDVVRKALRDYARRNRI